jgi:hypothetical protein
LKKPGDPELRHHAKSNGEVATQLSSLDGSPEILMVDSCTLDDSSNESPDTTKKREDNQIIEDEEGIEPVDDMALS